MGVRSVRAEVLRARKTRHDRRISHRAGNSTLLHIPDICLFVFSEDSPGCVHSKDGGGWVIDLIVARMQYMNKTTNNQGSRTRYLLSSLFGNLDSGSLLSYDGGVAGQPTTRAQRNDFGTITNVTIVTINRPVTTHDVDANAVSAFTGISFQVCQVPSCSS